MNRKLLFVFLIIALLVSACGGDDEKKEAQPTSPRTEKATDASTDTSQKKPAEKSQNRSPEELGKEIGTVYAEALIEVSELVKDKPAADELKPKLAALKKEYVQKLLALGQERETFDEADKATTSLHTRMTLDELYSDEAQLQAYNDALSHYMQEDMELYELLASFNIIGQYAHFELLIEQEPEEAVRLGILDSSKVETDTPAPTE